MSEPFTSDAHRVNPSSQCKQKQRHQNKVFLNEDTDRSPLVPQIGLGRIEPAMTNRWSEKGENTHTSRAPASLLLRAALHRPPRRTPKTPWGSRAHRHPCPSTSWCRGPPGDTKNATSMSSSLRSEGFRWFWYVLMVMSSDTSVQEIAN